ncbi:UTP--glucose-1-phosphate uridylyltransferase GalU [Thiolapillus brandeum]|uniref:UTP--glucose-1-phosphate uridylyltransferase n=1 Tax=Thiolapillus brandeum TaxID=1076588 RepID=A0A7U6JI21_9GAMM|nr:UTP--glucose-1-phosphate uridylyltransferase GalU [Thiolapillus brandeum]BAO44871.1 UTP--glucose-1-phosphate uridylyltransferase [Thiolapillus brandeum]
MIKKCLFPAAGYGTRFLPATKSIPKEMLPIVNKPLIQYGVEEASNAGMTDIAIVTGRGKHAIEDLFDNNRIIEDAVRGSEKESLLAETNQLMERCTFSYTRQKQMKGLGDAILSGEPLIGDQPFGVVLADDLCIGHDEKHNVLAQMVEIYNKYQCSIIAIEEVPEDETHKYGVIAGIEVEPGIYHVKEMVEKPPAGTAPSNLAIIGRYLLTPDIFDLLRNQPAGTGGEIQITDALKRQTQTNRVIAYQFQGRRFDCGSVPGFVEATNYFYEKYFK